MTAVHPLATTLERALHGERPEPDGCTEVVASPGPPADVLLAFTGHFLVAADVDPAAVARRCPPGDFSVPLSPAFLLWLGEEIGSRPVTHDLVLGAIATGAEPRSALRPLPLDAPHRRVARAVRFRRDVRAYTTDDDQGVLVLGRGVGSRWELAFEVEPSARSAGLGRALVASALRMLPAGTPVFAQVATGNVASLRACLAGGLQPLCAEVLFPRSE